MANLSFFTPEMVKEYGMYTAIFGAALWAKWDAIRAKRLAHKVGTDLKEASKEVAERLTESAKNVADKLSESEAKRDESLRQIHALVNGAMGNVLRKVWHLSSRIAAATNKPEDIQAETHAKDEYDSHMARQALVDKAAEEALKTFENKW